MAMTINSSPVLTGESARAFLEEAERNGKLISDNENYRQFFHTRQ